MHRSPLTRIVSALFALWFAVFTAEPRSLHACPVHDGPGAAHAGHAAAADTTHMSGSMDHSAGGHHKGSHEAGAKTCQCPGSCCTVTPVGLRSLPILEVPAVLELADSGLPEYEYVVVSRSLLLPFANGPPSTRA